MEIDIRMSFPISWHLLAIELVAQLYCRLTRCMWFISVRDAALFVLVLVCVCVSICWWAYFYTHHPLLLCYETDIYVRVDTRATDDFASLKITLKYFYRYSFYLITIIKITNQTCSFINSHPYCYLWIIEFLLIYQSYFLKFSFLQKRNDIFFPPQKICLQIS